MKKKYIEVNFALVSEEQKGLLIASLALEGFHGFEETELGLKAFVVESEFQVGRLSEIATDCKVDYATKIIEEQNWNLVWESNFEPVVVDQFVSIRADFHEAISGVEHEILITPKMSFGTGHHATTYMMMQRMKEVNFRNKAVLDFGTGTGVLAILSEKLGAESVMAIDNDNWSITNARENFEKNNCRHIELALADKLEGPRTFDIILANINRHIILAHLPDMRARLSRDGTLILSGLLQEDEADLRLALQDACFVIKLIVYRDKWIAIICN